MKSKRGSVVKEEKSGEISKLKKRIRKLEKDKRELVSKLNTLEDVLERNMKFLKGSTEDVSVEDLIEAAKNSKTLKEVKDGKNCPECGGKMAVIETRFGGIETCSCGYRRKV